MSTEITKVDPMDPVKKNSESLDTLQGNVFVALDVILTATVLAGGSDAINKIMKVYNKFMLSTENKTR